MDVEGLRKKVNDAQRELEAKSKDLAEVIDECDWLESQLSESKAHNGKLASQVDELQGVIEMERQRSEGQKAEAEAKLRVATAETERALQAKKDALDKITNEYNQVCASLQDKQQIYTLTKVDIDTCKKEVEVAQNALTVERRNAELLNQQIDMLKQKLTDREGAAAQHREKVEQLQHQVQTLSAEKANTAKLEAKAAEERNLARQQGKLQQEAQLLALQSRNSELESELVTLNADLKSAQQRIEELTKQTQDLHQLDNTIKDLEELLIKKDEEAQHKAMDIVNLKNQAHQAKQNAKLEYAVEKQHWEQQMTAMYNEKCSLQTEFDASKQQLASAEEALSALQVQQLSLRTDNGQISVDNAGLLSQVNTLQHNVQLYKQQLQESEADKEALRQEIEAEKVVGNTYRIKLEQLEKDFSQIQTATAGSNVLLVGNNGQTLQPVNSEESLKQCFNLLHKDFETLATISMHDAERGQGMFATLKAEHLKLQNKHDNLLRQYTQLKCLHVKTQKEREKDNEKLAQQQQQGHKVHTSGGNKGESTTNRVDVATTVERTPLKDSSNNICIKKGEDGTVCIDNATNGTITLSLDKYNGKIQAFELTVAMLTSELQSVESRIQTLQKFQTDERNLFSEVLAQERKKQQIEREEVDAVVVQMADQLQRLIDENKQLQKEIKRISKNEGSDASSTSSNHSNFNNAALSVAPSQSHYTSSRPSSTAPSSSWPTTTSHTKHVLQDATAYDKLDTHLDNEEPNPAVHTPANTHNGTHNCSPIGANFYHTNSKHHTPPPTAHNIIHTAPHPGHELQQHMQPPPPKRNSNSKLDTALPSHSSRFSSNNTTPGATSNHHQSEQPWSFTQPQQPIIHWMTEFGSSNASRTGTPFEPPLQSSGHTPPQQPVKS